MTTFYDRRAERAVASAMAEQHRADAAARLAEVELRRIEADAARAELADRQRSTAEARAAKRRRQVRAEQAKRRANLRAGLARVRTRLVALVPTLVGAVAMGAPILIGWNGQLQTARAVLHLGGLACVYPVALEGGAWWLAYLLNRAVTTNAPAGRLRAWMWLLAVVAAGMNFWHGTTAFGPIGGTGLALSSLLGIGLWELTTGHRRHVVRGRTAGQVRLAWLRWLRFPRLAWSAWSNGLAHGSGADQDAAWRAAWLDRYGVGPEATRRDRRLARLIMSAQWRTDRAAAKRRDLVIVSGVILRVLPTPLAAVSCETSETSIEMRKPANRAAARVAALLDKARAAIAAGTLPETPSAKAIRRQFGGGMEDAIAVRKALSALYAVNRKEVV